MSPRPMPVTELVRALAARRGFAGLTPTTRTPGCVPGRTSTVIEQLLATLREQPSRH